MKRLKKASGVFGVEADIVRVEEKNILTRINEETGEEEQYEDEPTRKMKGGDKIFISDPHGFKIQVSAGLLQTILDEIAEIKTEEQAKWDEEILKAKEEAAKEK